MAQQPSKRLVTEAALAAALADLRRQPVNPRTGDYTLAASDSGGLVTVSASRSTAVTLPKNSTTPLPVGFRTDILQLGDGQVLVQVETGVSPVLVAPGLTATVAGINQRIIVQKIAADTWVAFGALGATASNPSTPAATTASSLFSDTFPQADGAVLDSTKWALGKNPSAGGSATVQGNAARFLTGSAGGYAGADTISRRFAITDVADFELTMDFRIIGEVYSGFFFRSSTPEEPAAGTGYQVNLGQKQLEYVSAYNVTQLATSSAGDYATNTWYGLRVRVSGTSIKIRTWDRSNNEPTGWNFAEVVNSAKTAAGMTGIRVGGGGAGSQEFDVRAVLVTTPTTSQSTTPATTTTPTTTTPTPTQSGLISGLSVNGVDGVNKSTLPTSSPFYTWRGGTKTIGAVSTWADNEVKTTRKVWALSVDGYGPYPGILDIAIGGLYTGEGQTWAQAAAGAYDDMYTECLTTIATYRRGKGNAGTWIRPFHEFNGSWYPWALHNAQEIAYFKQTWVRIWNLKNQIFPEAKMHWSPNRETSGLSIKSTDAWPGNEYVDAVGLDFYFQWPGYPNLTAWTNHLNATDGTGGPKGIEAWRQFALSKGKPMCLPEWGTNSEPGDPAGPYPPYVDQPAAMTAMLNFLEANQGAGAGQIPYANYFNAAAANDPYSGKFGLYPYTESPQAAAAYKAWHSAR